MRQTSTVPARFAEEDCRLDDFVALVDQHTDVADYPHAAEVVQQVLVYDAETLRRVAVDDAGRETVQAELVRALTDGPGVVAFRRAFPETDVVDRATAVFEEIIAAEKETGAGRNDHFGSGANDRPPGGKMITTEPAARRSTPHWPTTGPGPAMISTRQ